MPAVHCNICLTHIPVEAGNKPDVVIFPCGKHITVLLSVFPYLNYQGHGYCTKCTESLFRETRPKCPHCRTVLHRREGHPFYLELVDSATVFTAAVIDGVDQMNADTPLISVKKASQKLRKVVKDGISSGDDKVVSILGAASIPCNIYDFQV